MRSLGYQDAFFPEPGEIYMENVCYCNLTIRIVAAFQAESAVGSTPRHLLPLLFAADFSSTP